MMPRCRPQIRGIYGASQQLFRGKRYRRRAVPAIGCAGPCPPRRRAAAARPHPPRALSAGAASPGCRLPQGRISPSTAARGRPPLRLRPPRVWPAPARSRRCPWQPPPPANSRSLPCLLDSTLSYREPAGPVHLSLFYFLFLLFFSIFSSTQVNSFYFKLYLIIHLI
jgi:hypothetical protein